jgi:hypothetical protein
LIAESQTDLSVVSMAVIVVVLVMAIPVSVAMCIIVAVSVAIAMVVVIFVLTVVIAVVVMVFFAKLVAVKVMLPAAVSAPVGMFASTRKWTPVSKARVVVAIDVSPEALRPAEPWPGAEKYASGKPLRAVIAKRRALVRRVIEIAIGTNRRYSDADADLCG